MSDKIEGKDESLWVASTPRTDYPALEDDATVYDLAIVGGGITGIAAAHHAQQRGLKTVLLDKARLAEWTTGGTTAKLASQHYLIYDHLIRHQGKATAQAFADANQRGIDRVESISAELGVDCEFSRRDAYVYSRSRDRLDEMRAEVESAVSLGLPASFETETDLPFDIAGAVKFSGQAQFHPRKFLLPLAQHVVDHGGVIYERTRATSITPGEPNVVTTEAGDIRARHVLQASGEPFWRRDVFDGFMWLKMSYALAVQLTEGSSYPESMYVTTDDPMRTMRSATSEGKPVLIFGGESHEYDDATFDADTRHRALIEDVRQKFDVDKVLYRWLAGDYMPYDRMPYIGAFPEHPSIHVITGFRAWGLAWAMSAAEAVVNDVAGAPDDWVRPFSLDRLSTPLPESRKVPGF
ncbi:NAD(P)/FAD-dependent oxidoreductase [Corynebacterium comes]|uniref:Gamma-glutamylputrescine oxidoreductase n=1 Tax=Corynebacterium comes TaxID=2675218 RepID=A0A6B8VZ52_9CORY|nr:FAD-binding oxidoreductase [Corynebacterium comes]QGU04335.1 Gamma-glutamylputrescine oxidoreductase [Corynebacterium comes]